MPMAPIADAGKQTYGQILKSSALIGGSSVISIAIGIVRTKAMAVLLGPAGIGLMGLYNSIVDLTQNIAGMGINSSGVRQIAEAVGSGDTKRVARTATVLRRTAFFFGLLGAVVLVIFCRQVSKLTFDTESYAVPVALLSVAVLLRSVSLGQEALIHGLRRISDLAKLGVLGVLYGTFISILLVYWFREDGLVPSLIFSAALMLATSWWFRRKIQIETTPVTLADVRHEAGALLKLGFAFMASGILTIGAAYAIRIIVLRNVSIEAAGLYQSAYALGGLYVGFILQAMGSDFYPRLTAIAKNHAECNRLVNEQAEVSLLLAGPGVLATLTFAPLVIMLFYTSKFAFAVEPLRWICLGMALRVIAWPMGFIVLAKGANWIFLWTEVAASLVHVGIAFFLIGHFGLPAAGMAFFGLYVWHSLLIYVIVRRLTGFRWSATNKRTGMLYLPLIGIVFCGFFVLPFWVATALGALAAVASSIYSLRALVRLVPLERMPRIMRPLLARFFHPRDNSASGR